jgi:amino acid transporter
VLIAFGSAATAYIGAISAVIIAVLVVVYLSYRQTIAAYPNGGGAYTVASENLGRTPALVASALLLDYLLNVAVAISAGVGAIVSALPKLFPFTLVLCLVVLVTLTIVNLRGVRDSRLVFMLPTYLFVASLGAVIVLGVAKTLMAGGHPRAVVPPPAPLPGVLSSAGSVAGVWVLLHAFASGCTAACEACANP